MNYYAQVAPLDGHGLPGRCLWRHCLLYLRETPNAPATRQDASPDDCIGVVWLHNPSARNRPNPIPQQWGRINVEPFRGDTLWTINAIMECVADNVPANALPQFPYIAIEELIYIDSPSVRDLWNTVPRETIRAFSILDNTVQLAYPRSKFLWIAWGKKPRLATVDYALPILLTTRAMSNAIASGRDLVGVGRQWNTVPRQYSTFHFSAAERNWTRYQDGQETEAEPPEEYGFEFPLHPYDFGQMLTTGTGDTRLAPTEDLVSALVKSLVNHTER